MRAEKESLHEENEAMREDQRVLEEQVPGLHSDLSRRDEQLRDAQRRLTEAEEAKVRFGCCCDYLFTSTSTSQVAHEMLRTNTSKLKFINLYQMIIAGAGRDGARGSQTAAGRPAGGEREAAE